MSFLQTVLFSRHLALYAPIFLTGLQNRGIALSSILRSNFLMLLFNRSSESNYSFRFATITQKEFVKQHFTFTLMYMEEKKYKFYV